MDVIFKGTSPKESFLLLRLMNGRGIWSVLFILHIPLSWMAEVYDVSCLYSIYHCHEWQRYMVCLVYTPYTSVMNGSGIWCVLFILLIPLSWMAEVYGVSCLYSTYLCHEWQRYMMCLFILHIPLSWMAEVYGVSCLYSLYLCHEWQWYMVCLVYTPYTSVMNGSGIWCVLFILHIPLSWMAEVYGVSCLYSMYLCHEWQRYMVCLVYTPYTSVMNGRGIWCVLFILHISLSWMAEVYGVSCLYSMYLCHEWQWYMVCLVYTPHISVMWQRYMVCLVYTPHISVMNGSGIWCVLFILHIPLSWMAEVYGVSCLYSTYLCHEWQWYMVCLVYTPHTSVMNGRGIWCVLFILHISLSWMAEVYGVSCLYSTYLCHEWQWYMVCLVYTPHTSVMNGRGIWCVLFILHVPLSWMAEVYGVSCLYSIYLCHEWQRYMVCLVYTPYTSVMNGRGIWCVLFILHIPLSWMAEVYGVSCLYSIYLCHEWQRYMVCLVYTPYTSVMNGSGIWCVLFILHIPLSWMAEVYGVSCLYSIYLCHEWQRYMVCLVYTTYTSVMNGRGIWSVLFILHIPLSWMAEVYGVSCLYSIYLCHEWQRYMVCLVYTPHISVMNGSGIWCVLFILHIPLSWMAEVYGVSCLYYLYLCHEWQRYMVCVVHTPYTSVMNGRGIWCVLFILQIPLSWMAEVYGVSCLYSIYLCHEWQRYMVCLVYTPYTSVMNGRGIWCVLFILHIPLSWMAEVYGVSCLYSTYLCHEWQRYMVCLVYTPYTSVMNGRGIWCVLFILHIPLSWMAAVYGVSCSYSIYLCHEWQRYMVCLVYTPHISVMNGSGIWCVLFILHIPLSWMAEVYGVSCLYSIYLCHEWQRYMVCLVYTPHISVMNGNGIWSVLFILHIPLSWMAEVYGVSCLYSTYLCHEWQRYMMCLVYTPHTSVMNGRGIWCVLFILHIPLSWMAEVYGVSCLYSIYLCLEWQRYMVCLVYTPYTSVLNGRGIWCVLFILHIPLSWMAEVYGLSCLYSIYLCHEWQRYMVCLVYTPYTSVMNGRGIWSVLFILHVPLSWMAEVYGVSCLYSIYLCHEWQRYMVCLVYTPYTSVLNGRGIWSVLFILHIPLSWMAEVYGVSCLYSIYLCHEWQRYMVCLVYTPYTSVMNGSGIWCVLFILHIPLSWMAEVYGVSCLYSIYLCHEWQRYMVCLVYTPHTSVLNGRGIWSVLFILHIPLSWMAEVYGVSCLYSIYLCHEWQRYMVCLVYTPCTSVMNGRGIWCVLFIFHIPLSWMAEVYGVSCLYSIYLCLEWQRYMVCLVYTPYTSVLNGRGIWCVLFILHIPLSWMAEVYGVSCLYSTYLCHEWQRYMVCLVYTPHTSVMNGRGIWSVLFILHISLSLMAEVYGVSCLYSYNCLWVCNEYDI